MMDKTFVPISDSISQALDRLFKTGGFALAFGFGGLILILAANVSRATLQLPVFLTGWLLVFACLTFFIISSFRTREVASRIKDDLPLLDSLQRVALQLSDFSSLTQAFAFKHMSKVQQAIETVVPIIESIPLVGPAAKQAGLADAAKLSNVIVATTENAKDVVRELEEAIRKSNLKAITQYASQLDAALYTLRTALSGGNQMSQAAEVR